MTAHRDDPTGHGFMGYPDLTPEALHEAELRGNRRYRPTEAVGPPTDEELRENLRFREGKGIYHDDPHGLGFLSGRGRS